MSEDAKKIVTKEKQDAVQTGKPERVFMPAVDICEDGEKIRLVADMPGVDDKSVDVSVENGVLSVEGNVSLEPPEGHELVGSEYESGRYRRDFTLSERVDVNGIGARVKNGVLELTIPKREEIKTRKVEITGE